MKGMCQPTPPSFNTCPNSQPYDQGFSLSICKHLVSLEFLALLKPYFGRAGGYVRVGVVDKRHRKSPSWRLGKVAKSSAVTPPKTKG